MARDYLNHTLYAQPIQIKRLDWVVGEVEKQSKLLGRKLRLLDMGCGTGMVAMPLASLGHSVDACDLDAESVTFAGKNHSFQNLKFFVADCTSEEFVKQVKPPYDVVLASDVIEHVERPDILIRNAIGCGSATSVYLFTTCSGYSVSELYTKVSNRLRFVGKILPRLTASREALAGYGSLNVGAGAPHLQRFTRRGLQRLFEGFNLAISEIDYAGSWFSLGSFGPFRSQKLQSLDLWMGARLPHALAGGWNLSLRCRDKSFDSSPLKRGDLTPLNGSSLSVRL